MKGKMDYFIWGILYEYRRLFTQFSESYAISRKDTI